MATITRIVRIGNSRGLRVPKSLLEQAQLSEEIEVRAEPGRLLVTSLRRPRHEWEQAARRLRQSGHDRLLDGPAVTRFDEEEWKW